MTNTEGSDQIVDENTKIADTPGEETYESEEDYWGQSDEDYMVPDDFYDDSGMFYPGVRMLRGIQLGYGVSDDGKVFHLVRKDTTSPIDEVWVADGYARISEELHRSDGTMMYYIEGRGAISNHTFHFHINASDFADKNILRRELAARFGSRNVVSGLTGDVIKRISIGTKNYELIEVPSWVGDKAAVPGLDIHGVRYVMNKQIPVNVSVGNLKDAQKCLSLLMKTFKPKQANIAVMGVLAGPVAARYFPGDRFVIVKRAGTGSKKTTFDTMSMGIYGRGYLDEKNLMGWGLGATKNGYLKVAAVSGFIPLLIDNYKPLFFKDAPDLVQMIHAICEGSDKVRLDANSEFKENKEFNCILIVNGEDFVEDPATQARCVVFDWAGVDDIDKLTEAQRLQQNLPAIGREWLLWLQESHLIVEDVVEEFEVLRRNYSNRIKDAGNGINADRVASNLALLNVVWKLALICPATRPIFIDHEKDFEDGMNELLEQLPSEITQSNEGEMFVAAIKELVSSGKARVSIYSTTLQKSEVGNRYSDEIGWVDQNTREFCVLPGIARKMVNEYMPTIQHLSSRTLYEQLDRQKYIKTGRTTKGKSERTLVRKRPGHGKPPERVLVFDPNIILDDSEDL